MEGLLMMYAAPPPGKNCKHCGKPLKPIGTGRKNGVPWHDDWKGRIYHKKCFVMLRRAGRL